MSETDNCYWFNLVAGTIADHVEQMGGAVAVRQDRYRKLLTEKDPLLVGCPDNVWQHYRVAFRRHGLNVCGYAGNSDSVLLIYTDHIGSEMAARKLIEQRRQLIFSRA